ncbi:MAG: CotH kinase family protein [Oscillospiraceae bacterium]|nr:CotH kinase family protein [Oscillospiraceae bacterium]
MAGKTIGKIILLLCAVAAFAAVLGAFIQEERSNCMGIQLLDEKAVNLDKKMGDFDLNHLTFDGQPVAFDKTRGIVYISQSPAKIGNYYTMEGELRWNDPDSEVWFVKNEQLMNLEEAIKDNEPLQMYIANGKQYQLVKVVITTLPVIRIDGEITHKNEDNRYVYTGNLCMWTGKDPSTGIYSVKTSNLEWHVRGNTTAKKPKKPWKLSLKDENGENLNMDFLGLGADDDWILNCLTMDDTKMKEKLFMDYWNTLAAREDHMFKMSTGEYVEVVINNKYLGLFLMQRRVDAKYLELAEDDVLLKVVNYGLTKAEEAYEFITPPVNEKQIYATMQKVLDQKDSSMYNLDNMIDTNLMMQFTAALDNQGLKNMFHVLIPKGDTYEHYFVPWDTDQSLGVVWSNEKKNFDYDFFRARKERIQRKETVAMAKLHPDYYQMEAVRWFELRQELLIEEDILRYVDEMYAFLSDCGAFERDTKQWGIRYEGQDTVKALKRFISARLEYLDEYYTDLLER